MRVKPTDPVNTLLSDEQYDFYGMSHRTHIAAQIMAGFATDPAVSEACNSGLTDKEVAELAKSAVQWADALIAELNKTKGE